MKPTHSKKATASPLNQLRKQTAYGMARFFLSVPFCIAGVIMVVLHALALGSGNILQAITGMVWGLFLLSVPAIAHGFFDMADCALRQDQRDTERDARQNYEAYKKSQGGY